MNEDQFRVGVGALYTQPQRCSSVTFPVTGHHDGSQIRSGPIDTCAIASCCNCCSCIIHREACRRQVIVRMYRSRACHIDLAVLESQHAASRYLRVSPHAPRCQDMKLRIRRCAVYMKVVMIMSGESSRRYVAKMFAARFRSNAVPFSRQRPRRGESTRCLTLSGIMPQLPSHV